LCVSVCSNCALTQSCSSQLLALAPSRQAQAERSLRRPRGKQMFLPLLTFVAAFLHCEEAERQRRPPGAHRFSKCLRLILRPVVRYDVPGQEWHQTAPKATLTPPLRISSTRLAS